MVKLDKIYTRGGDKGFTSLGDGKRVGKYDLRVDTYGDFEEANSVIGIAIIHSSEKIKCYLKDVQNDLFDLGADLCMPDDKKKSTLRVTEDQVKSLEENIDELNGGLNQLTSFVIPGGTSSSSYLHFARCVVRRAERKLSRLIQTEKVNEIVLKYINRLSDFLFVASRFENKITGDILWKPGKTQQGSDHWKY